MRPHFKVLGLLLGHVSRGSVLREPRRVPCQLCSTSFLKTQASSLPGLGSKEATSVERTTLPGTGKKHPVVQIWEGMSPLDLAFSDGHVKGAVLESCIHPSGVRLATVLVQSGTLKKEDVITAGHFSWAKVRSLFDEWGNIVQKVPAGFPVQVIGCKDDILPDAGDKVNQVDGEKKAKDLVAQALLSKKLKKAEADAEVAQKRLDEHQKGHREKLESLRATGRRDSSRKRGINREKEMQDDPDADKKINLLGKAEVNANLTAIAFSTAEEYNLEALSSALAIQGQYQQSDLPEDVKDVLYVKAKSSQINEQPNEVFIFREGTIVFWNVSRPERETMLRLLKNFATNSFNETVVNEEREEMDYKLDESKSRLNKGIILLNATSPLLGQYTFSNALGLSVKLATWESSLDSYVESIEWLTQDMKLGKSIKLTRDQVFRKTGKLFALRHNINLSSDLLDTPDFYWDRDELEVLFQQTCSFLNLGKRTRVLNEKLNHCCALMDLVSDHLNDNHHVRLEWMIIVLIMVEVAFEILHFADNFNHESATEANSEQ